MSSIPIACTVSALPASGTLEDVPASDLITPEQAAYNALSVFFNDTPAVAPLAGTDWGFSGTLGSKPLNYLQIYWEDINYAQTHGWTFVSVVQNDLTTGGWSSPLCPTSGCTNYSLSALTLLDGANAQLLKIAEHETTCISAFVCLF